jgi:hypothetical protein
MVDIWRAHRAYVREHGVDPARGTRLGLADSSFFHGRSLGLRRRGTLVVSRSSRSIVLGG